MHLTMGTWLILIAFYFLPWLIASTRQKRNRAAIGLVNLFFGWTIIGWAIALIWASMQEAPEPQISNLRS
jgi:hypothetical protein